MIHIALAEWERKGPDNCSALAGVQLSLGSRDEALIRSLRESGKLEVLRLSCGTEIRSRSWVGQVAIGDLLISVRPKIQGAPLVTLLRYAYALRDLRIYSEADFPTDDPSFADLLIAQLAAEAAEVLARGLHRDYLRFEGNLAIPRGRVNFTRLATATAMSSSVLPCAYFDRSEAIFINRILLAGLQLAWRLAGDPSLKRRVAGLIRPLEQLLSPEPLSRASLDAAIRLIDRRTSAYGSILTLVQLLLGGCGFALGRREVGIALPGFLFDMNVFFQSLMSRFLREAANGYTIEDQHQLHEVFEPDLEYPPRRAPPVLRPDFAVFVRHELVELLDAKYRDLWELPLPVEMLYQLSMYVLGNPTTDRAVILYPTVASEAVDQAIRLRDPVHRGVRGTVVLRPVNLLDLAELSARAINSEVERARQLYAQALVFGPRGARIA